MTKEERLVVAREFLELNNLLTELSDLTLKVHEAATKAVQHGHTVIKELQQEGNGA